jgi:hypothetical protein
MLARPGEEWAFGQAECRRDFLVGEAKHKRMYRQKGLIPMQIRVPAFASLLLEYDKLHQRRRYERRQENVSLPFSLVG